jgi:hypothetical protein
MGFTKGAKVRTSPSTLMSNTVSNAGRSSSSPVSVPTDTPALPITMSGTPNRCHERRRRRLHRRFVAYVGSAGEVPSGQIRHQCVEHIAPARHQPTVAP